MFFICFSWFHISWYLCVNFQSNLDCSSNGLHVLGITCTYLSSFTGYCASLTDIIVPLAAAMAFVWSPESCFVWLLFYFFLFYTASCKPVLFFYCLVCLVWYFLPLLLAPLKIKTLVAFIYVVYCLCLVWSLNLVWYVQVCIYIQ